MSNSGGELIRFLTARDEARTERRLHRLPADAYAADDCQFFFTLCARHLGQPFTDPTLAHRVVEALLWRRQRHRWALFCYCLMPDHLHFLVELPEGARVIRNGGPRGDQALGILDHVGDFKRYTTNQIWRRQGGSGRLWQRSSYDRVLRHDGAIEEAAWYVLNNPVRKALVVHWNEYPYAAIVDPWW